MKKNSITYRIISLALAFLMFFTSIGFSIDMHYCGNHLKSFNLFGKAKNCYELAGITAPETSPSNEKHQTLTTGCSMDKKDCCQNRSLSFQTDLTSDTQTADFVISQPLLDFIVAFVVVYLDTRLPKTTISTFDYYKPPLIVRDIPVFIQSFLI